MLAGHPKSRDVLYTRTLKLLLSTDVGGRESSTEVQRLDPDNAEAEAARWRFKNVMDAKQVRNTRF